MAEPVLLPLVLLGVLCVILGVIRLRRASLQDLVLGLIAAIIGLLLGALASVPVGKLPEPLGGIMPLLLSVIVTIVLVVVALVRKEALLHLLPFLKLKSAAEASTVPAGRIILVDTSVIIDGRIADIADA